MTKTTDVAIIGFGKAGKTLAVKLASAGKSVILMEENPKRYGGTCINVACIPTKTLTEKALLSAKIGGSWNGRKTFFANAVSAKDKLIAVLRDKNYHKLADNPAIQVIDGHASFIDNTHLKVNDDVIEAKTIVINTGSKAFVPPIPGVDSKRVYTSENLLELTDLPKRLVIVGGGYIGLEFASMFLNFGSQVTMLQKEEGFLPREDEEVAKAIEADFAKRGLVLIKGADTKAITSAKNHDTVHVKVGEKTLRLPADAILIATGRKANLTGLEPKKAGVQLNQRGAIQVDSHDKTIVSNIYAVGDVAGGLQFTYISLDDARIVLSDMNGGTRTTENRGFVPYSVFIDPPFSRIGLSEKDARASHEVLVATLPAAAIPKAGILEKTSGLLKAIVDKNSHEILGVHLYCAESHEMINLIKLAMDHHLPYEALRDNIYTHPTMSEGFNDLFANLK